MKGIRANNFNLFNKISSFCLFLSVLLFPLVRVKSTRLAEFEFEFCNVSIVRNVNKVCTFQ